MKPLCFEIAYLAPNGLDLIGFVRVVSKPRILLGCIIGVFERDSDPNRHISRSIVLSSRVLTLFRPGIESFFTMAVRN